jgi:peroxiredoxin
MRKTLLACVVIVLASAAAARAQEQIGFKQIPSPAITLKPFTDAEIDDLIATLDTLLSGENDPAKWGASSRIHFWRFQNRLEQGILAPPQEAHIVAYLDDLAKKHPDDAATIAKSRDGVTTRTIGKIAPEITGKDLDGAAFKLSDYRGKVVVIYFSGEWCGPCRGEYPYQRLMLEVYKDQPFAILSVNSDTLEVAKKAKIEKKLDYRSWWDGDQKETTKGPIATAWNVTGWPTIYILDRTGAIRFVNLRGENVLVAVRQLMRDVPKPPMK